MKAVVFSRDNCGYCVRAKALLEQRGVPYEEIAVDETNRATLIERVMAATVSVEHPKGVEPRTLPQIFLDGEYVGGFDQLNARFKAEA